MSIAKAYSVGNKPNEFVSVVDYGAVGDGVTDDTAAIQAAEAAAFASGSVLHFPKATYVINSAGSITIRVSVDGDGSTIDNTTPTEQSDIILSTLSVAPVATTTIKNIHLIGNGLHGGMCISSSAKKVYVSNVSTYNTIFHGIASYGNSNIYIDKCHVEKIAYKSDGSSAADGFYLNSAKNSSITNCTAVDFRRIGFVIEGSVSDKSEKIRIDNCHSENGNNCDDSPTEFNAGFWFENTNDITVNNVVCKDIASGVGQTSGRVVGLVLSAIGSDTESSHVLSNFILDNSSDIEISGDANNTCLISNGVVKNYTRGLSVGPIKGAQIENVDFINGTYTLGSYGAIVVTGGATLEYLNIHNVTETNPTYTSNDAATINFFQGAASCDLTLSNVLLIQWVKVLIHSARRLRKVPSF